MTSKTKKRSLLVVGRSPAFASALQTRGGSESEVLPWPLRDSSPDSEEGAISGTDDEVVVILLPRPEHDRVEDWLRRTRGILAQVPKARVVLMSSLEVYGPDHHAVGMVDENTDRWVELKNDRAEYWDQVEAGVTGAVGDHPLLVLRLAHIIGAESEGWVNRLLRRRRVVTVAGFDPTIQLIDEASCVEAVHGAIERGLAGVYNVAPPDAVPVRKILKSVGVKRFALPWSLLWLFRKRSGGYGTASSRVGRLAYLRYPCTGSGERFAKETGIELSTIRALEQFPRRKRSGLQTTLDLSDYNDPHGMDVRFTHRAAESWLKFFEKVYWRIERKGFEHIPAKGPAILAGPHRGFMPLDAVMLVQMITKYTKRMPRFLLHPTLVKFSVISRFLRRMGGVMACKKNADTVLRSGDLLGIFPEGIRGAFKYYKDVYHFGRFGRSDYVRFAVKHDVPVIPFAVVGAAEIYPILGKLEWKWMKRHFEWPCIPITPTFPILPIPLPAKWHVEILPAVHPEDFREAAEGDEEKLIALLLAEVKGRIEKSTAEILKNRKSIYYGNVFDD